MKRELVAFMHPLLHDGASTHTHQQQLMQLVPLFDETKQYLRSVETDDRSVPNFTVDAASEAHGA